MENKILVVGYMAMPGIDKESELQSIKNMIEDICDHFEIKVTDLTGNRNRKIVDIKRIISYLIKEKTTFTLKNIAEFVGVTDHTTVKNHIKTFYELMDNDKKFKEKTQPILDKYLKKK